MVNYLWLMVDDYLCLMVRKYLSGWWLTYESPLVGFNMVEYGLIMG